jgi:hypothetical protein
MKPTQLTLVALTFIALLLLTLPDRRHPTAVQADTDSWEATSLTNAPDGRREHVAVWTGSEMLIWGGQTATSSVVNTGARYNPGTNT